MPVKGLVERLKDGEDVIVAEGYLFEFERRGYLQAGGFVPEVVLEHPDLVKNLYEEFVHAGSDVVLAFTYYGHREKMALIGREDDIERLNVTALQLARQVADDTGTLMAGNICNSAVFDRNNKESIEKTEAMFKEQIEWAVKYNPDYILAETFSDLAEAMLGLECIKKYGNGLPAVVTLSCHAKDYTFENIPFGEACRKLEEAGAAVVGLNCGRGPKTMMPVMKEIRSACKGPIAAVPVPYRTTKECPAFQNFRDKDTGKMLFPDDLPAKLCSRSEIAQFGREAKELGINYVGICCGNSSHYIRTLAETLGRHPPASRYSTDLSKHFIYSSKGDKFNPYYNSGLRQYMAVAQD